MKNLIALSFVATTMLLVSGCGFKSDLYLSDITPVPDTVLTELPTLPPVPQPDTAGAGSVEPTGVAVTIPELEDNEKKKSTN